MAEAGYSWLAVLAVINTVISLFYYFRVLAPVYLEQSSQALPLLGRYASVATTTTAGAVVVIGILAEPLLSAFDAAVLLPR